MSAESTPSTGTIPPVLYLPTSGQDLEGLPVELRQTADGRTALLAYTALDRLGTCCGPDQPWALVPTDKLDQLGIAYDVIYLDMAIPEELWHRGQA